MSPTVWNTVLEYFITWVVLIHMYGECGSVLLWQKLQIKHHSSYEELDQKAVVVCVRKSFSQHLPGKTVGKHITAHNLNLVSPGCCHFVVSFFKTYLWFFIHEPFNSVNWHWPAGISSFVRMLEIHIAMSFQNLLVLHYVLVLLLSSPERCQ
jgi:hypothetical protein